MNESNGLSERELEILRFVATGASNKEIAKKLFISTNTVKVHLRNIFAKIGVASRTEAAMYAIQIGLVLGPSESAGLPVNGLSSSDLTYPEVPFPVSRVTGETRQPVLSKGRLAGLAIIVILILFVVGFGLQAVRMLPNTNGAVSMQQLQETSEPRWETKAPMSEARAGMAAAVYSNQIYLIGGENKQGVSNLNERYDPTNGRWETMTNKPQAVADVQAAVIGGKIFVPGGRLSSGFVTDVMEYYDPGEDTWRQAARLPVALSAYALVAFEGKLYLFGGWDGEVYRDEVYSYDPEPDEWIRRTSMPVARGQMGAVVSNDKIYVMGGYDGTNIQDSCYLYSPEDDHDGQDPWQAISPLPQGRYAMGIAIIADRVYIVGGIGATSQSIPELEYQTLTDTWSQRNSRIGTDWSHLSLVALGSRLYAYGGLMTGSPMAKQMVYQPFYTVMFPIVGDN